MSLVLSRRDCHGVSHLVDERSLVKENVHLQMANEGMEPLLPLLTTLELYLPHATHQNLPYVANLQDYDEHREISPQCYEYNLDYKCHIKDIAQLGMRISGVELKKPTVLTLRSNAKGGCKFFFDFSSRKVIVSGNIEEGNGDLSRWIKHLGDSMEITIPLGNKNVEFNFNLFVRKIYLAASMVRSAIVCDSMDALTTAEHTHLCELASFVEYFPRSGGIRKAIDKRVELYYRNKVLLNVMKVAKSCYMRLNDENLLVFGSHEGTTEVAYHEIMDEKKIDIAESAEEQAYVPWWTYNLGYSRFVDVDASKISGLKFEVSNIPFADTGTFPKHEFCDQKLYVTYGSVLVLQFKDDDGAIEQFWCASSSNPSLRSLAGCTGRLQLLEICINLSKALDFKKNFEEIQEAVKKLSFHRIDLANLELLPRKAVL